MSKRPDNPEWTRYGVAPNRGVELLHAHYVHHSYERHAHDVYALGVTEAGVQSFSYRRSFYASTTGTTLLLLPSEMHDGRAGTPEGFTYRMLYIEPSLVRDMVEDATERASPLPVTGIPLIRDPVLGELVRRTHSAFTEAAPRLTCDTLLSKLLVRLATRHSDAPAVVREQAASPRALGRVREFLSANFAADISADDIAGVAGMSRFHLSRQFQRYFGLPPHAYLVQVRLNEARRRLAAGEPAAEVAAAVGFADQSHLTKRFKGSFGITPGQFARAALRPRQT